MEDAFGDRMKVYEMAEAGRKLLPLIPIIARLDGRSFSKFTKGLERPFDRNFSECMIRTTKILMEETNANCGYTQSDEITLAWLSTDFKSEIWFGGRIQKMNSILAAYGSVAFNRLLPEWLPQKVLTSSFPVFDCRVWNVPNPDEGANAFLWREQDASKNSISMAARHYYPHRELMDKNGKEMQEMLFAKGVNWNEYPTHFKRGTYIQRRTVKRKMDATELESRPPLHHARQNPDLEIERSELKTLDMPKLGAVSNRAEVIFFGEEPIIWTPMET